MKNLLLKIQTELRNLDGVRDRDVYISVDADIIPEHNKFPCIGIKDGKVTRHELMASVIELEMGVSIFIYDKLIKGKAEALSMLDLAVAVHTTLKDNALDGYIRDVSPAAESPVQVLYRKGMDALLLRKIISYEYEREE